MMIENKFNGLATFIAVVEAGSFTAAAEKVHLTRSAVAKATAALELRLKIRLFNRTTRKIVLTDEGARYYEQCKRLVTELSDLESALHDGQMEVEGRVRISAPVLFGRHCIAPVLRMLVSEHNELKVEAEFSDRVVDILAEGFDLAVRIGSISDSSSLIARKIGSQRMAIFASPEYLKVNGTPASIAELKKHTAILYGRTMQEITWRVIDHEGKTQAVSVQGKELYDDLQVVADSAVNGGGLAWLPRWLGSPFVESGKLQLVMDSDQVESLNIYAVWPHTKYLPLRTRILIDKLLEHVPLTLGELL